MIKNELEVAELIKRVALEASYERGAVCAVDLLLQSKEGKLEETMEAWKCYLIKLKNNESHCDESRHNAWVPAIPLKA